MTRDSRYDVLFEPVKIGPVTARNRFYQVPHCTGLGWLRPRMVAALRGIKAEGGWSVVCTEYCSIHPASDDLPHPYASLWDQGDIRALEPNLKIPFERGLLFDSISHVLDPLALCQRYAECFQRQQGRMLRQRALEVIHGDGQVQIRLDNGDSVDAERVVIAAGAFSKGIEGIPTRLLKLDTERGYHVQFGNMQHLLSRPVSWHHAGFYATPMNLGLRFAGTVEIAGNHPELNPRIINYLTRKAHEMLELPAKPDQEWLGFRPTCPDALPVIGFSTVSEHVIYAFGHHHLGLTLSGITGKLVAELANGEEPSHNIAPFSPRRFL